jgi:hypothetical protein
VHNGRTTGKSRQVRRRRERGSRGATFVVVMQTAAGDDRAAGWRLGTPLGGSILVQREGSAPLVKIGGEGAVMSGWSVAAR